VVVKFYTLLSALIALPILMACGAQENVNEKAECVPSQAYQSASVGKLKLPNSFALGTTLFSVPDEDLYLLETGLRKKIEKCNGLNVRAFEIKDDFFSEKLEAHPSYSMLKFYNPDRPVATIYGRSKRTSESIIGADLSQYPTDAWNFKEIELDYLHQDEVIKYCTNCDLVFGRILFFTYRKKAYITNPIGKNIGHRMKFSGHLEDTAISYELSAYSIAVKPQDFPMLLKELDTIITNWRV